MNSLQQTSIQYQHRILMLCSSVLNESRSDCMLWLLLLQQCCSSCSTFAAVADLFFSAPSFVLSIIPMFIFFLTPLLVPYFLSHLCWLLLTNLQPSSPARLLPHYLFVSPVTLLWPRSVSPQRMRRSFHLPLIRVKEDSGLLCCIRVSSTVSVGRQPLCKGGSCSVFLCKCVYVLWVPGLIFLCSGSRRRSSAPQSLNDIVSCQHNYFWT